MNATAATGTYEWIVTNVATDPSTRRRFPDGAMHQEIFDQIVLQAVRRRRRPRALQRFDAS